MSEANKQLTKALSETKEEPLLFKLRFEVSYFISNLFTPIAVFKEGIIRLFKWLPIIWKDRDFDEHYMVEILQFKLRSEERRVGKECKSRKSARLAIPKQDNLILHIMHDNA